jgi:hypothetical protein
MNAHTEIQDKQASRRIVGLLPMFCASALFILSSAALISWLQGPTGTMLDHLPLFMYWAGVPLVALLGMVLSRYGWLEVGLATMAGAAMSTFILAVNDPFAPMFFGIAMILQIPGLLVGLMIGGVVRVGCRAFDLKPGFIDRLRAMVLLGGAVIALTAIALGVTHSTEIIEGLFSPVTGK